MIFPVLILGWAPNLIFLMISSLFHKWRGSVVPRWLLLVSLIPQSIYLMLLYISIVGLLDMVLGIICIVLFLFYLLVLAIYHIVRDWSFSGLMEKITSPNRVTGRFISVGDGIFLSFFRLTDWFYVGFFADKPTDLETLRP